MLQAVSPIDYVVATGETHSIREFLTLCFSSIGESWESYVTFDKNLLRPKEVPMLKGDSSLIRKNLKWKPQVTFKEMVELMLKHDIQKTRRLYGQS